MIYATEIDAIERINALQRIGIWPGYYRAGTGWRLTFDPAGSTSEFDAHGYLKGA